MRTLLKIYVTLLTFAFRLLYNEMAWTYDAVSWVVSLGRWRKWQQACIRHLQVARGETVLELAHGTANLQLDMKAEGIDTVGLDISSYMGQIARRKLKEDGLPYQLVRGNAYHLPFPNAQFSAVVSTFPTEFFFHTPTLKEVHRVLVDGGRYVIVPNGLLTLKGPVTTFLEWLYRITGQRGPWPEDFLDKFRETGFAVEHFEETLEDSIVSIIVAEKPRPESDITI